MQEWHAAGQPLRMSYIYCGAERAEDNILANLILITQAFVENYTELTEKDPNEIDKITKQLGIEATKYQEQAEQALQDGDLITANRSYVELLTRYKCLLIFAAMRKQHNQELAIFCLKIHYKMHICTQNIMACGIVEKIDRIATLVELSIRNILATIQRVFPTADYLAQLQK